MRRYLFLILWLFVLALPFGLRLAISNPASPREKGRRLVIVTPHNQDIRREFEVAFQEWHQRKYNEPVSIDYRMPGGANDIKRVLETTYRAYLDADGSFPSNMPVDIDVVWGGGDYFFDRELKQLFERNGKRIGVLEPIDIDPATLRAAFPEPTLAGVKLYDVSAPTSPRPDAPVGATPASPSGFTQSTQATQASPLQGSVPHPQWIGVCVASYGIVYNPDLYQSL